MRIAILTCVQGRLDTLQKCLDLTPNLDRVFVYSDKKDGDYLRSLGYKHIYKFENNPLSDKWNYGVEKMRDLDYDYIIMMGADNYFDAHFLDFVYENAPKYDMLGFVGMYFTNQRSETYYWQGYTGSRIGEPAGAGKVYSKDLLNKIDYNLFTGAVNRGLDRGSWGIINSVTNKIKISSLQEEGIWLCDIKDGKGLTPLSAIRNIVRV